MLEKNIRNFYNNRGHNVSYKRAMGLRARCATSDAAAVGRWNYGVTSE
ncbi:hypothetical protein [Chlorobaculum thiosulfatiphilum]|nr:hypothetical protein [Chlorobaculum thiosulfatiphilum]